MRTSDNTHPAKADDGNTLVAELLAHKQAHTDAVKHTSKANPFLTYYKTSDGIELTYPGSLRAAKDETLPLYIVAKENPIQSFSLIARKVIPNTLGSLSKNELRNALGSLLDNA
jgi:hypothetical protein